MSAKASLASQIEGKVLTPGDEGYDNSLLRWASNFERRAQYVVYVKSVADISKTVIITIYLTYRRFYGPARMSLSLP